MQEELEKLIDRIIEGVKKGELDSRIDNFTDYKSKYAVLRPSVKVKVELREGKVFEIDVSDYFQGGKN